MKLLFLQEFNDSLNNVGKNIPNIDNLNSTLPEVNNSTISLIDLLQQGGFIMYPLYFLLAIAIFVFIQKLIIITGENRNYNFTINLIKEQIKTGNIQIALDSASKMNNAMGRILHKGIQKFMKAPETIEKTLESAAKLEIYRLEKNLNILSLIAGIAPMFGFLGTIIGMVQLFYNISATAEYTLNTIASGIYTKMVTSASGLIIGLLAYIAHNYLTNLIDKKIIQLEVVADEVIDSLQI